MSDAAVSPKKSPIRRLFSRIPWWGWLGVIGLLGWFGRGFLLIVATVIAFHPIPIPPLFAGEPETRAEAQLQDLDHFDHVRRKERSMSPEMEEQFVQQTDYLRSNAGELTDAEFMLGLARAQAVIDNGHSNTLSTAMTADFPQLPLRFTSMDGEMRVLRAREGNEDLLGAQLLAINGTPVDEILARFRNAFGGNDQFFLAQVPPLIGTPAYLSAIGADNEDSAQALDLVLEDGSEVTRLVAPLPADPEAEQQFAGQLLQPWLTIGNGWSAVRPEGNPLYLQNAEEGYWLTRIADGEIAYLSLRTNHDDESGESLADFADRARRELQASPARAIIVDQRFNQGGDLTITNALMRSLPDALSPDGRIYLLTSGNTFSAAIVNLAAAKEAAPDRTLLVGEPIGDRLQFWAEGWAFDLPNSGFRARFSTGYYDLQNGCSGFFICPWGSLHLFPILVDDLDIDIAAPMDWESYRAGRDPALEAILQAEEERSGG